MYRQKPQIMTDLLDGQSSTAPRLRLSEKSLFPPELIKYLTTCEYVNMRPAKLLEIYPGALLLSIYFDEVHQLAIHILHLRLLQRI